MYPLEGAKTAFLISTSMPLMKASSGVVRKADWGLVDDVIIQGGMSDDLGNGVSSMDWGILYVFAYLSLCRIVSRWILCHDSASSPMRSTMSQSIVSMLTIGRVCYDCQADLSQFVVVYRAVFSSSFHLEVFSVAHWIMA